MGAPVGFPVGVFGLVTFMVVPLSVIVVGPS